MSWDGNLTERHLASTTRISAMIETNVSLGTGRPFMVSERQVMPNKTALMVVSALVTWHLDTAATRPSLSLEAVYHPQARHITLTWTNGGEHTLLLLMGGMVGEHALPNLQAVLSTSSGEVSLFYDGGLGVMEGRGDPWVLILPPACTFSMRLAIRNFRTRHQRMEDQLGDWPGHHWKLAIIWNGVQGFDELAGRKIPYSITKNGPTAFPFWIGKLIASVAH